MRVTSEVPTDMGMETKARLLSYGLLSKFFSYPEVEIFELDGDVVNVLLKELGLSSTGCDMVSQEDKEKYLEELQCEYTRLFRNALPKVPLPPYESVYTDGEGLLWGTSTLEVLSCYRETGLDFLRANDKNTIPDHIAVELEFMAYLIAQEAEAATQDDKRFWRDRQRLFLEEHLLRWVPQFFQRVAKESKVEFYRILAQFGYRFLSAEKERAEESTGDEHYKLKGGH